MQFGFGPAVDNTATWILAGLVLSAMLMPYVDRDWIAGLPPGLDVPVAALLGLPIYVCATGSTPLAAMLLVQGLSPGAVLAFLLTGPATNVTTFGVLARLHGGRTAFVFAVAMWIGAVALGYLANWLIPSPAHWPSTAHAHDATLAGSG
ncbi:MAG: permease [Planctomycetes bacterium]|nr:permease [Planctomycetota bacterium]